MDLSETRIRTHRVKVDGALIDLSYATLERNGRVLMTFDSVRRPEGNETRAAFSSLICPNPVLFVEQESWRTLRTWIVALTNRLPVVFDSRDWSVRDWGQPEDLDGDGVSELRGGSLHYWFFDDVTNPASPYPEVIFQFDAVSGKFLPANTQFADESKSAISEAQAKVAEIKKGNRETSDLDLRGAVAAVVTQMCYSGHVSEAWKYFDEHYDRSDRDKKRVLWQQRVEVDPVYRAMSLSLRRFRN